MIDILAKGRKVEINQHFDSNEFDCKCNNLSCALTFIESMLTMKLYLLRYNLGCPVTITSAYRCFEHQEYIRSKKIETTSKVSTHQKGMAVDIWTGKHTGLELEKVAREAGFMAVGVAKDWVHLDTRDDKKRRWEYKK